MMVRSPISESIFSWDSFIPTPMEIMMTIAQQPTTTPRMVSMVRARCRKRFFTHMRMRSLRFIFAIPFPNCELRVVLRLPCEAFQLRFRPSFFLVRAPDQQPG